jgi:hypothetical protein
VTPCCLVGECQGFGGPCRPHLQGCSGFSGHVVKLYRNDARNVEPICITEPNSFLFTCTMKEAAVCTSETSISTDKYTVSTLIRLM